jgi:diacylglycerol O-acyltransferase
VPGPQFPLYMLGRRLEAMYPMVPLAATQALGVAVMSYDGHVHFGLNADFDALPDVEDLAGDLREAIAELVAAAGVTPRGARRSRRRVASPS